jgi:CDP-glucose 4,6-dehydratase
MHTRNRIPLEDTTLTVQARQRLNWSLLPTGKVFSVQEKILVFVLGQATYRGGDWEEPVYASDCSCKRSCWIQSSCNPPWQFVLDPLFGYLWLGLNMKEEPEKYTDAWNFCPDCSNTTDVRTLVEKIIREWGGGTWKILSQNENAPHEAGYLKLDSAKSMTGLGWKPVYSINEAVQKTVRWYRRYYKEMLICAIFIRQIEMYMHDI